MVMHDLYTFHRTKPMKINLARGVLWQKISGGRTEINFGMCLLDRIMVNGLIRQLFYIFIASAMTALGWLAWKLSRTSRINPQVGDLQGIPVLKAILGSWKSPWKMARANFSHPVTKETAHEITIKGDFKFISNIHSSFMKEGRRKLIGLLWEILHCRGITLFPFSLSSCLFSSLESSLGSSVERVSEFLTLSMRHHWACHHLNGLGSLW